MGEPKKYGLIIPTKKSTSKPVKKLAVFGDDSSDDEDAAHKEVNLSLLQESQKKKQMKQTQIEIQKALEQDPSVYEYDAIYDQMEEKKKGASVKVPEEDRKPKYMESLLKAAAARKRDFERTVERQVQKEREQEEGDYDDKEAFVTDAFRKKMQEQAEEEERIKRQDAIDAANDVTKQKDLSLFYRNLLNQNVSLGGSFAADDETNSKSIESEDLKNKPGSELLGKVDDKDKEKESENKEQAEERNRSKESNRRIEKHRKEKDNKSPKAKEKCSRRNYEQEQESQRHARSPDRHRRHHEHSRRRRSNSDSDENRKGHSSHSHRTRERKRQSRSDGGESRHRHSERRLTSHDEHKHSDHSERERTNHDDQKGGDRKRDDPGSERNREEKNVPVTDQQGLQTPETRQSKDVLSEESKSKFAKRSTNETVLSAKERYLARKLARESAATTADNDGSGED